MRKSIHSGFPSDDVFERLGVQQGQVAPWEDGMRTDGGKGSYEWWYFDAHLDNGAKLVIVFMTKSFIAVNRGLFPLVTLQYDTPEGRHYEETLELPAAQFSAAKDCCDVRVGDNRFAGDLSRYTIRVSGKTVQAEVMLEGRIRSWRPGAGHIFFGDRDEHYFAWLPAVPEGCVAAEITVEGQTAHISGTGYHDHNWGNISMPKLMNHWYWGRARIGEYTAITSYITAEKKYGYQTFPIFMLAKDGEVIADNALEYLTFSAEDEYTDAETQKPCHNLLVYDYDDGRQHYKISYRREKDIVRTKFTDTLSPLKRTLARLAGIDGAYLRFTGTAALEKIEGGKVTESLSDPAIWELMYLGHAQK